VVSRFDQARLGSVTPAKLRRAGIVLVVAGLVVAFAAWIGLFTSKSERGEIPIHKWQIGVFAFGVWLLGWGLAMLVPLRWRRYGVIYMLVITPITILIGLGLARQLPA
jgi:hypothetical protein